MSRRRRFPRSRQRRHEVAPRPRPRRGAWAAAGLAAMAGLYVARVRPWILTWGAAPSEVARPLPGDERVPRPRWQLTRAITIDAPPVAVWPWLVQIGQGRGGMYSYDWLENLAGGRFHSADRILPEFQTLAVGDVIPLLPDGSGPSVVVLEANRALVLAASLDTEQERPFDPSGPLPPRYVNLSWGWFLEPSERGKTRLIERARMDYDRSLSNALGWGELLIPISFIMDRKMMLGLRARAEAGEASAHEPARAPLARPPPRGSRRLAAFRGRSMIKRPPERLTAMLGR